MLARSHSYYLLLESRKPSFGPPVSRRAAYHAVPRYYFRSVSGTSVFGGEFPVGPRGLRAVCARLARRASALRQRAVRYFRPRR